MTMQRDAAGIDLQKVPVSGIIQDVRDTCGEDGWFAIALSS